MEHNKTDNMINTNLSDYTIDELFTLFDIKIDNTTDYTTLIAQIETNGQRLINTFKDTNPHLSLFFEKALKYLTKNQSFKEDSLTSLIVQPNQEHDNDYLFKLNNSSGNPINRKTVSKLINIDSRFRIDKTQLSTNFSIKLQNPQSKIIEMKLCDLELPTTYYPISTALNNNYMWIRCHIGITNTDIYNYIFIPDGNYYFDNLISYINGIECLKSPELAQTPLSIFFDLNYNNGGGVGTGTGKITFGLFNEEDVSFNEIDTNIDFYKHRIYSLLVNHTEDDIRNSDNYSLSKIFEYYACIELMSKYNRIFECHDFILPDKKLVILVTIPSVGCIGCILLIGCIALGLT